MPMPPPLPDDVLEAMAEAMLEPALHDPRVSVSPGNPIRKKVLLRALAAARQRGWMMQRITPTVVLRDNDTMWPNLEISE